ncbi:MAG TPA: hypothetical protein DCY07_04460 [Rhodospirillaceae bacterium]|nr:hypothetical protein [Rhodospirillaceae bacterium]
MSILSTTVLALSMSADAFAVSIGKGTTIQKPRLLDAAKTGAVFGGTEACAPVLGWLAGSLASTFIQSVDHWAAFGILLLVGLHMIYESTQDGCEVEGTKPHNQRLGLLIITAIGTSIDSMAVGVSLAFVTANIWVAAASIGLASFTMSTLGLMIGHSIGCRIGRLAEVLGGIGLIGIGVKILCEHTGVLGG